MNEGHIAQVNCPMCAAFLFEGTFRTLRAPHCRGDVFATLTDEGGIVVKWSPRLRGGRILGVAPITADTATAGQSPEDRAL